MWQNDAAKALTGQKWELRTRDGTVVPAERKKDSVETIWNEGEHTNLN